MFADLLILQQQPEKVVKYICTRCIVKNNTKIHCIIDLYFIRLNFQSGDHTNTTWGWHLTDQLGAK